MGFTEGGLFQERASLIQFLYKSIYAFHMPFFIMLSGFLFNRAYIKDKPPVSSLDKPRFTRQIVNLVILYFVYSALLIILKKLFSSAVIHETQIGDLLNIFVEPYGLFWYLYVLIECYCIFGLTQIRNVKPAILFPILSALCVASQVPLILELFGRDRFCLNRTLYNLLYFYVGMHLTDILHSAKLKSAGWVLFGFTLLSVTVFRSGGNAYAEAIRRIVVALGVSFFLVSLFSRFAFLAESKVLRLCGRYSLEIYLLHTYADTAARNLLPKAGIDGFAANLLLSSLLGTGVPIAIGMIAKKVGIYNLLFHPSKLIFKAR